MLSSTLLVLGVQALTSGVAALAFDWVDGLPSCWRNCLKDAGCNSQKCICESSANSNAFLPSAVSCAASKCDADDWALDLALLGPLGLFCSAINCDIPDEIMSSAQVAATATAAPQSTAKPTSKPKTSKHDDDDNNVQLQTTVTKTLTHTTTDDQGHTLQVIVPIVMGPKTLSTGKMVTSTLQDESPSSTQAPSSAVAIPTDDAPAPTQAPQAPVATTAAPTQKSNSNAKGNGSPFENMQAGAQQWSFSVPMISLGLVAGLFMRL